MTKPNPSHDSPHYAGGRALPIRRTSRWFVYGTIILLIIAASIVTFVRSVRPITTNTQGSNLASQLELAIMSFDNEYDRYPVDSMSQEADTTMRSDSPILAILTANDTSANPRSIVFIEPMTADNGTAGLHDGVLVDPWGEMYFLVIDTNRDGQIENPDPAERPAVPFIKKRVLVHSSGPDGDPATWDDNISTWR